MTNTLDRINGRSDNNINYPKMKHRKINKMKQTSLSYETTSGASDNNNKGVSRTRTEVKEEKLLKR